MVYKDINTESGSKKSGKQAKFADFGVIIAHKTKAPKPKTLESKLCKQELFYLFLSFLTGGAIALVLLHFIFPSHFM